MEQTLIIGGRESIYFKMHAPRKLVTILKKKFLKVDGRQTPVFLKMQRVSLSYRMVVAGIQLIKA